MKILIVCGTRPEIIKLAPVYHFLRTQNWCKVTWLHTGQHQEMAEQILDCFDIVPDIVLTRAGSSLSEFSIGCRQQLDVVMESSKWSTVIVQGDTESAFLGGLSAFYQRIPVAHVEAGLGEIKANEVIVDAILDLARGLHMEVIAEGVETREQYEILYQKGCGYFQGWYFGRPSESLQEPLKDINTQKYNCDASK